MKKTLLAVLALVLLASPALALPDGPDGDLYGTGYFEIIVEENLNQAPPPPAPKDIYETERFNLADGWDFGDRYGYTCAWVEYFQGSNERFEVHYEMRNDYKDIVGVVQINDKFGAEVGPDDPSPNVLCGEGVPHPGTAGKGGIPTADGTDHFPHMIHPGDGITFFADGQPLLDAQGDPVFLDLTKDQCSKAYWVPGDEPGEAWLWWDEDGPTFSHSETEGELPCGGGPAEPVAVLRLIVQKADADIGYCTHSMDEEQCTANLLPVVSSFAPTSGTEGVSVTLTGQKFTGATAVKFNGTSASFTINSATSITATVPTGATDGPISVTTPRGTGTSASSFDVLPPVTQVSIGSGLSQINCPGGGVPTVQTTSPLVVQCP